MASPDGVTSPGVPPGLRELLERFEGHVAEGFERLVAGEGFAELLVGMTENTVAIWRMNADTWDLWWRALRLPARPDIDRLARQLARTEDKLELVLQAVERLQDTTSPRDESREPAVS
jgi:hypothetical protein